ncbi:MAG: radical SAM protein [Chloroflexi bacterium]|nr:radical SAM protein [Chloroflexota bacterium]
MNNLKTAIRNVNIDTPKPNQLYYNAYFAAGLLAHPRRALNLLKYKLSKFKYVVNYHPMVMDIEPTQRCNYKCAMCITAAMSEKRQDMTFDTFRRILDEQFGLMEVKIQGVGEPLLNKDFFRMVDYAKKKLLWVRTTTNGSLLHVNDNYRKLVDSRIHDVNISIDGCTPEVYNDIRLGGDLHRIETNCRLINEYNNKVKKTTVRAWAVLQKKNKHQFFDFPHFFAGLGFTEMALSFALHNYGREGDNAEATDFTFTEDDIRRVAGLAREAGIKMFFWFHPSFSGDSFCQIPFGRVYITTDGHILPCCYIANQEVIDFGDYRDFKKIWFEDYTEFRERLKKKDPLPAFCRQCHGGHG